MGGFLGTTPKGGKGRKKWLTMGTWDGESGADKKRVSEMIRENRGEGNA